MCPPMQEGVDVIEASRGTPPRAPSTDSLGDESLRQSPVVAGGSITGRKGQRMEAGAVTVRHVETVCRGNPQGFVGVVWARGASGSVGALLRDHRQINADTSGGVVRN